MTDELEDARRRDRISTPVSIAATSVDHQTQFQVDNDLTSTIGICTQIDHGLVDEPEGMVSSPVATAFGASSATTQTTNVSNVVPNNTIETCNRPIHSFDETFDEEVNQPSSSSFDHKINTDLRDRSANFAMSWYESFMCPLTSETTCYTGAHVLQMNRLNEMQQPPPQPLGMFMPTTTMPIANNSNQSHERWIMTRWATRYGLYSASLSPSTKPNGTCGIPINSIWTLDNRSVSWSDMKRTLIRTKALQGDAMSWFTSNGVVCVGYHAIPGQATFQTRSSETDVASTSVKTNNTIWEVIVLMKDMATLSASSPGAAGGSLRPDRHSISPPRDILSNNLTDDATVISAIGLPNAVAVSSDYVPVKAPAATITTTTAAAAAMMGHRRKVSWSASVTESVTGGGDIMVGAGAGAGSILTAGTSAVGTIAGLRSSGSQLGGPSLVPSSTSTMATQSSPPTPSLSSHLASLVMAPSAMYSAAITSSSLSWASFSRFPGAPYGEDMEDKSTAKATIAAACDTHPCMTRIVFRQLEMPSSLQIPQGAFMNHRGTREVDGMITDPSAPTIPAALSNHAAWLDGRPLAPTIIPLTVLRSPDHVDEPTRGDGSSTMNIILPSIWLGSADQSRLLLYIPLQALQTAHLTDNVSRNESTGNGQELCSRLVAIPLEHAVSTAKPEKASSLLESAASAFQFGCPITRIVACTCREINIIAVACQDGTVRLIQFQCRLVRCNRDKDIQSTTTTEARYNHDCPWTLSMNNVHYTQVTVDGPIVCVQMQLLPPPLDGCITDSFRQRTNPKSGFMKLHVAAGSLCGFVMELFWHVQLESEKKAVTDDDDDDDDDGFKEDVESERKHSTPSSVISDGAADSLVGHLPLSCRKKDPLTTALEGPFMVTQGLWNTTLRTEDSVLAVDVYVRHIAVTPCRSSTECQGQHQALDLIWYQCRLIVVGTHGGRVLLYESRTRQEHPQRQYQSNDNQNSAASKEDTIQDDTHVGLIDQHDQAISDSLAAIGENTSIYSQGAAMSPVVDSNEMGRSESRNDQESTVHPNSKENELDDIGINISQTNQLHKATIELLETSLVPPMTIESISSVAHETLVESMPPTDEDHIHEEDLHGERIENTDAQGELDAQSNTLIDNPSQCALGAELNIPPIMQPTSIASTLPDHSSDPPACEETGFRDCHDLDDDRDDDDQIHLGDDAGDSYFLQWECQLPYSIHAVSFVDPKNHASKNALQGAIWPSILVTTRRSVHVLSPQISQSTSTSRTERALKRTVRGEEQQAHAYQQQDQVKSIQEVTRPVTSTQSYIGWIAHRAKQRLQTMLLVSSPGMESKTIETGIPRGDGGYQSQPLPPYQDDILWDGAHQE